MEETNKRLRTELPEVLEQRDAKAAELADLRATAHGLMNRLANLNGEAERDRPARTTAQGGAESLAPIL